MSIQSNHNTMGTLKSSWDDIQTVLTSRFSPTYRGTSLASLPVDILLCITRPPGLSSRSQFFGSNMQRLASALDNISLPPRCAEIQQFGLDLGYTGQTARDGHACSAQRRKCLCYEKRILATCTNIRAAMWASSHCEVAFGPRCRPNPQRFVLLRYPFHFNVD
jgi:hypothetical protein